MREDDKLVSDVRLNSLEQKIEELQKRLKNTPMSTERIASSLTFSKKLKVLK
jgi:hypothetical protein